MNLLVLMYHRARAERHGNSPEMLDAHFCEIARSHSNVLPGEKLAIDQLNVCISFDDGYFDFYRIVFPLLKKYGLRALLALPPQFIRESVTAETETRQSIASDEAFAQPDRGGLCTWREIREMVDSGLVKIAGHGFSHQRLDSPDLNLSVEIELTQSLLSARLGQTVDSFVFPYGRYSEDSLDMARELYRYVFRIGSAINRGWESRLIYRVDADQMDGPTALFSPRRLALYRARYFWNRLRQR